MSSSRGNAFFKAALNIDSALDAVIHPTFFPAPLLAGAPTIAPEASPRSRLAALTLIIERAKRLHRSLSAFTSLSSSRLASHKRNDESISKKARALALFLAPFSSSAPLPPEAKHKLPANAPSANTASDVRRAHSCARLTSDLPSNDSKKALSSTESSMRLVMTEFWVPYSKLTARIFSKRSRPRRHPSSTRRDTHSSKPGFKIEGCQSTESSPKTESRPRQRALSDLWAQGT